jgi:hypothetical protein
MKYLPQWTRRVAMDGSGRDPLGLSRVSDALTGFLLPNIITTTDRARYYSFYTWAIADIEALRQDKGTRISFEEEFQRREAAFALASRLDRKTDLPIVGIRNVNAILASRGNDNTIETDFPVLPSNQMGGYGQYYGGCLHDLGLVCVNENGEYAVTSEFGRKLAEAFTAATTKAPYLAGNWRGKVRVPKTVLADSAEWYSLDALAGRAADAERELLIRLFFELDDKPSATRPLNRQATLGMFLHVLQACEDAGIAVSRRKVDGGVVFWPHYYDGIPDADHDLLPYQFPPTFTVAHEFWRQFTAHQFLAFALEEFLAAVLDALSPFPEGLTQPALLDELVGKLFVQDLKKTMGADCSSPSKLLRVIGFTGIPDVAASRAMAKKFCGESRLNEWTVCKDRKVSPATRLGRAILLLALLYGKWRGRDDEKVLLLVADQAKEDAWLGTIFSWLDEWNTEQLDWREAVARILEWTSQRHDLVKYRKRKLDASWLEIANGRFVKQQDLTPHFRASRHENATTLLMDLGLIKYGGLDDTLKLMARGKQVLKEVIRLRS